MKISLDCCLQWLGFIQTPFGNLPTISGKVASRPTARVYLDGHNLASIAILDIWDLGSGFIWTCTYLAGAGRFTYQVHMATCCSVYVLAYFGVLIGFGIDREFCSVLLCVAG